MSQAYVTQTQIAELVELVDRRLDGLERGLNRMLLVLGSAQLLTVVLVILVLDKVGL